MNVNRIWYKKNNDWFIGDVSDKTIDKTETHTYKDIKYNEINDVVLLPFLNEPSILQSIHSRFDINKIYTDCGEILISINPFRFTDLYTGDKKSSFKNKQMGDQSHIYNTVLKSYNYFNTFNKNQSILISGESGAGKTQSTKIIIDYLTFVVGSENSKKDINKINNNISLIKSNIIQSNPILEAFGNAKTIKNDNSSRFGKFIKIKFNEKKDTIIGGYIETYLLETVRVLFQNTNERNYHIFYELLTGIGKDNIKNLNLDKWFDKSSSYLTNGVITRDDYNSNGDKILDNHQFQHLKKMLSNIGIGEDKQNKIWNIIAFILIIGTYKYELNMNKLQDMSNLIECSSTQLLEALYTHRIIVNGESIHNEQSEEEFYNSRDGLATKLYSRLFRYIVDVVNCNLNINYDNNGVSSTKLKKEYFIGILDIFGFESLQINSFEQLCINYANETLQNQFNKYSLEQEQKEYEKEGIKWKYIEFINNIECIHLIGGIQSSKSMSVFEISEKHSKIPIFKSSNLMSVFEILDEQCKVPNGNDNTFLNRMNVEFKDNIFYKNDDRRDFDCFYIKHYADDIKYNISKFCEKNKDITTNEINNIIENYSLFLNEDKSKDSKLEEDKLDKNKLDKNKSKKSKSSKDVLSRIGSKTVSYQFKNQMKNLMNIIEETGVQYVRCFKPNDKNDSTLFDRNKILSQLQNNGILEAIKVSRGSFPIKYTYKDLKKAYFMLLNKGSSVDNNLIPVKLIDKSLYQYGKTKVFLKATGFKLLEDKKEIAIEKLIIKVQQSARKCIYKNKYVLKRRASIRIENKIRQFNAINLKQRIIRNLNSIKIQSVIRRYIWKCSYLNKIKSINLIKKSIKIWINKINDYGAKVIQTYYRKFIAVKLYSAILCGFTKFIVIIKKRLFNTKVLKKRILELEIEVSELRNELHQKSFIEDKLNKCIIDLKKKIEENSLKSSNSSTSQVLDNKIKQILDKLKKENKELKLFKNKFIETDLTNVKLKEDNYSYVDCLKKNIDLRINVQKKLDEKNDENAKMRKILEDNGLYNDFVVL